MLGIGRYILIIVVVPLGLLSLPNSLIVVVPPGLLSAWLALRLCSRGGPTSHHASAQILGLAEPIGVQPAFFVLRADLFRARIHPPEKTSSYGPGRTDVEKRRALPPRRRAEHRLQRGAFWV